MKTQVLEFLLHVFTVNRSGGGGVTPDFEDGVHIWNENFLGLVIPVPNGLQSILFTS